MGAADRATCKQTFLLFFEKIVIPGKESPNCEEPYLDYICPVFPEQSLENAAALDKVVCVHAYAENEAVIVSSWSGDTQP